MEHADDLAALSCCREGRGMTFESGVEVVKKLGGFAVGLPVTTDGEMW